MTIDDILINECAFCENEAPVTVTADGRIRSDYAIYRDNGAVWHVCGDCFRIAAEGATQQNLSLTDGTQTLHAPVS